MTEHIVSPTRVDFAGGTLDCWPLYNFVDGCITTNLSIDIVTEAELSKRDDKKIVLDIQDGAVRQEFDSIEDLFSSSEALLTLLKAHLNYWKPEFGFNLRSNSQSPIGGGLGGSSSLTVSLIKAFSKVMGKSLGGMEIVTLASNVEAQVLHTPTGTQDYFPAIRPGLHALHYELGGVRHEVLDVNLDELGKRLFLVYTGKPHHSGLNNWSVIQATIGKDKKTLIELQALKEIASEVYKVCQQQKWSDLAELFKQEFKHRVALAPAFSSPEIEKLNDSCLRAGAEAVKICGAGGGGCVMVWCDADNRTDLMNHCESSGFQVFNVAPFPVTS